MLDIRNGILKFILISDDYITITQAAYPKQCGISIVVVSTEEPFFFSKDVIVLPYSLC